MGATSKQVAALTVQVGHLRLGTTKQLDCLPDSKQVELSGISQRLPLGSTLNLDGSSLDSACPCLMETAVAQLLVLFELLVYKHVLILLYLHRVNFLELD